MRWGNGRVGKPSDTVAHKKGPNLGGAKFGPFRETRKSPCRDLLLPGQYEKPRQPCGQRGSDHPCQCLDAYSDSTGGGVQAKNPASPKTSRADATPKPLTVLL